MGKLKEELLNNHMWHATTTGIDYGEYSYLKQIDDDQWDYYNTLDNTLPSVDYAFDQITIQPSEVGIDVFKELIKEQILIYFNR